MKLTCATIGRIVATTIDNARCAINETVIFHVHAAINPLLELFLVAPCTFLIWLYCIEPVEKAGHPFELRRRTVLAD